MSEVPKIGIYNIQLLGGGLSFPQAALLQVNLTTANRDRSLGRNYLLTKDSIENPLALSVDGAPLPFSYSPHIVVVTFSPQSEISMTEYMKKQTEGMRETEEDLFPKELLGSSFQIWEMREHPDKSLERYLQEHPDFHTIFASKGEQNGSLEVRIQRKTYEAILEHYRDVSQQQPVALGVLADDRYTLVIGTSSRTSRIITATSLSQNASDS